MAAGRLLLIHRLSNEEVLDCLDVGTGKTMWTSKYPASYRDRFGFDEGPRAVPTIEGGRSPLLPYVAPPIPSSPWLVIRNFSVAASE